MSTKKIKLIFWIIPPVILGIFFTSFIFRNIYFQKIPSAKSNEAAVIQLVPPASETSKSQYFYVNKNASEQPKISAKAFLVGDLNTGEVILSKNQDQKFPIASVSKLMTALVTTEITKPDDLAQVTKTALATEGTNGELRLGQKIKTADLLYPLLLESSNDAAEVLAQYFGRDNFISKMNQEAENLRMSSTSFGDPSGLSANNQSTVSDLFKLTGYLMQNNPDLLKITTERSYSNKKQSWSNISQFLGETGYLGGKSGYTDAALQTDVAVFSLPLSQIGYRPIAITLLQSADRHKDVETILKYLNKNIYYGGLADASTNWVEEKIGTPDIKDPNFVTMAFAGDIMLDRGVRNSVVKNFNNDYSALFQKLNILKKTDIVFANLEGTASDQGKDIHNLYSFRMDPAVIPALKGAGIGILSVANNHIGDWGLPAFSDTLARLKENEILYTGGGLNKKEAEAPTIIEKYGMRIGFLGFSDVGPESMKAGENPSTGSASSPQASSGQGKAGILLASDPDFDEIIQNASKQVDYLIVSFHFGTEYQTKHNARQEYLAYKAADDGAKIIIGTHPHVVEDTEVYSPKNCTQSSCTSFIAYSLGNFIFDQPFSKNTMQGMLLEIKLNRDGTMTDKKDIVQLNSAFQPDKITEGKEEKINFQTVKTASTL